MGGTGYVDSKGIFHIHNKLKFEGKDFNGEYDNEYYQFHEKK